MVPVFNGEGSAAEEDFSDNYRGNGVSAVLYNKRSDPSRPGYWGADATVEEIMHTINAVGHTEVYPDAFGLAPNSSLLTAAMDVARGGQFISHPGTYPEAAWYHYDDTTCDYQCMAIEYLYWAQVSNMEILNDPQSMCRYCQRMGALQPRTFGVHGHAGLRSDHRRPIQVAPVGTGWHCLYAPSP